MHDATNTFDTVSTARYEPASSDRNVALGSSVSLLKGQAADSSQTSLDRISQQSVSHQERPKAKPKNKTANPANADVRNYKAFRLACDEILIQAKELIDGIIDDKLGDGWEGAAIEIESLLFKMRSIKWGEGDSLKRWVSTVLFQVSNAKWEASHARFVYEATRSLRSYYLISQQAIDECISILEGLNLNMSRGIMSDENINVNYKIVPVDSTNREQ